MKPKHKTRTIIITIILLILLCALLAAVAFRLGLRNASAESVMVTYKVVATEGKSRIQYTEANGKDTELINVDTPWEKRVRFTEWMDIYLIAGNNAEKGSITCEILVNGVSKIKQTAVYPEGDKVGCQIILP